MREKQAITEEMGVHAGWYARADKITMEELPGFLEHLMTAYQHDYGTICHALAAGSLATAHAMNRADAGGITGFQAGAVMWQWILNWGAMGCDKGTPMRLLTYDKLLYPQYESNFTAISKDTWKWAQEEAAHLLEKESGDYGSDRVRDHWRSIVFGNIPFGLTIDGEE